MGTEMTCAECGVAVSRTGPTQRYCATCSEKRDLLRKKLWARKHPRDAAQTAQNSAQAAVRKECRREAGAIANHQNRSNIAWYDSEGPELLWLVRAGVPFSYAASKNHIYALCRAGHLRLRRESRQMRAAIVSALRTGLHCAPIVHNRVWIDILVQKPNHKGDAVNVVDLVCDAVKEAVGVDDRWFCIRRLDWEIVKDNPRLFVGVGQDSDVSCQICSYCGQIKPFSEFNRSKHNRLGIGRECRECRRNGRVLGRQRRTQSSS